MKTKKFFTGLVVIVLLLSICSNEADGQIVAKWSDQSDELPGMASDGEMLLIAAGGVVIIGGLVALLVIKKKKDKEMESKVENFINNETVGSVIDIKTDFSNVNSIIGELNKASEQLPVQLFTRCNSIPNTSYSFSQGLSVGVRIRF